MDIICPNCGEMWDHDTLHEEAEESGRLYVAVMRDFQQRGCNALEAFIGGPVLDCKPSANTAARAQVASAMYDLLGDDMDGAAAMLEDFERDGLI